MRFARSKRKQKSTFSRKPKITNTTLVLNNIRSYNALQTAGARFNPRNVRARAKYAVWSVIDGYVLKTRTKTIRFLYLLTGNRSIRLRKRGETDSAGRSANTEAKPSRRKAMQNCTLFYEFARTESFVFPYLHGARPRNSC